MRLSFSKYHGTGNDFVLIDGRKLEEPLDEFLVAHLCHRNFGIGADGVIVVRPSEIDLVDYEMDYYNSDGRLSSMCGNGARCAFHFARMLDLVSLSGTFEAFDGIHTAVLTEDGLIAVSLKDVESVEERSDDHYVLNTGSPHYVIFVPDIEALDIIKEGANIRYNSEFMREGINVNLAQISDDAIVVRTYERGVEDMTLSCGTGVTAVVIAFAKKIGLSKGPVHVLTDGGPLSVDFKEKAGEFTSIQLVGPAVLVFDGAIDLDSLVTDEDDDYDEEE